MKVGRSELLLLDADREENTEEDRLLTEGLYKGDSDPRMRQQILLGVGGMKALAALGYEPTVYHLNEGHAAFAPIQRVAGAKVLPVRAGGQVGDPDQGRVVDQVPVLRVLVALLRGVFGGGVGG